jgi:hypothetical protein
MDDKKEEDAPTCSPTFKTRHPEWVPGTILIFSFSTRVEVIELVNDYYWCVRHLPDDGDIDEEDMMLQENWLSVPKPPWRVN